MRKAQLSIGVRDVSGGVTLANTAKAKLVAKDSVGSNELLGRNPKLAFPLPYPCHSLRQNEESLSRWEESHVKAIFVSSRVEMKRVNINLFTPSHKNSGIFDLHYAHILLAVLWKRTKGRRSRISTRGWLRLPALKRCAGSTNSSSQGSNQAVFICARLIWAARSFGFHVSCQLFSGTLCYQWSRDESWKKKKNHLPKKKEKHTKRQSRRECSVSHGCKYVK